MGLLAPQLQCTSSTTDWGAGETLESTGTKPLSSFIHPSLSGSSIVGWRIKSCSHNRHTAAWQCAPSTCMCSFQAPNVGGRRSTPLSCPCCLNNFHLRLWGLDIVMNCDNLVYSRFLGSALESTIYSTLQYTPQTTAKMHVHVKHVHEWKCINRMSVWEFCTRVRGHGSRTLTVSNGRLAKQVDWQNVTDINVAKVFTKTWKW